jgi:hypothetical protein
MVVCSVLCSRFAVRGSRFAVRGSRFAVRGSRFSVRGSLFAVLCSRFFVRGCLSVYWEIGRKWGGRDEDEDEIADCGEWRVESGEWRFWLELWRNASERGVDRKGGWDLLVSKMSNLVTLPPLVARGNPGRVGMVNGRFPKGDKLSG